MGTQELFLLNNTTPDSVASDLINTIELIDEKIKESKDQIENIEGRGIFKNAFSSNREDLLNISKSQNSVNDMMLCLTQEIIKLNVMSYSFLTSVICELDNRTSKGWIDSDGKIHHLSKTGQDFASKARNIFLAIAEGSKNTQSRINGNEKNISEIRSQLSTTVEKISEINHKSSATLKSVSHQSDEIEKLKEASRCESQQINSIKNILSEKSLLDLKQEASIKSHHQQLSQLVQSNKELSDHIKTLKSNLASHELRFDDLISLSEIRYRRLFRVLIFFTVCIPLLAIALVLNVLEII